MSARRGLMASGINLSHRQTCKKLTSFLLVTHPSETSTAHSSYHSSQTRTFATHRPPPKRPVKKVVYRATPENSNATGKAPSARPVAQSYDLDGFKEFQESPVAPHPEISPETLFATWKAYCQASKTASRQEALNTLPLEARMSHPPFYSTICISLY